MNEKLPKIIEAIAPLIFFLIWVIVVILLSILGARGQRQHKAGKPAPPLPHPPTPSPRRTREDIRVSREEEVFARSWDEMIREGESLVPSAPSLLLHEEELIYTQKRFKSKALQLENLLTPRTIPTAFILSQCFSPPRAIYRDFPLAMKIILEYHNR